MGLLHFTTGTLTTILYTTRPRREQCFFRTQFFASLWSDRSSMQEGKRRNRWNTGPPISMLDREGDQSLPAETSDREASSCRSKLQTLLTPFFSFTTQTLCGTNFVPFQTQRTVTSPYMTSP